MRLKKIRLDFKYCERGRFYRTLLVKEDMNLVDLGCAILTAFNAAFEHCFYFKTKDHYYNPRVFMEDFVEDNELLMNNYTLEDLGDKFEFCYDTGDGWDFTAKVYKKPVDQEILDENEEDNDAFLIEGAGLGIYEDNISTLYNYLEGNLDPDSSEEDEDNSLPWNLNIEKYGDFDEAFHIEEEIERFSSDYLIDRQTYWDVENAHYPLEDEEDEDEEMPADGASNERLHNYLIQAVHEQMSNLEYVKKTYERLLKTCSEEEAIDKIAAVLVTEIYNMHKETREFNEEQYIKDLSELK